MIRDDGAIVLSDEEVRALLDVGVTFVSLNGIAVCISATLMRGQKQKHLDASSVTAQPTSAPLRNA